MGAEKARGPFRHCVVSSFYPQSVSRRMLTWLSEEANWRYGRTSFYEQFAIPLMDIAIPSDLAATFSERCLGLLRRQLETVFVTALEPSVDIAALKFVRGHGIGVHTDFGDDPESHRVVVQLNGGRTPSQGGELVFLRGRRETDVDIIFSQESNLGIAFEIGPTSFHALSEIESGECYMVVYSFRPRSQRNSIRHGA
jgi:hypothetical protein